MPRIRFYVMPRCRAAAVPRPSVLRHTLGISMSFRYLTRLVLIVPMARADASFYMVEGIGTNDSRHQHEA